MLVRLWLIEHRLTAAEENRLRELRSQGRDGNRGPDKITYRKKRVVKDVETESLEKAKHSAINNIRFLEGVTDVYSRFTTVFAAAPAEDGEKCLQIENAWSAEDQDLPMPGL